MHNGFGKSFVCIDHQAPRIGLVYEAIQPGTRCGIIAALKQKSGHTGGR